MSKRIVLTGGLSGGHTFPLVAVAREIRTLTEGEVEFLFLGTQGPFEVAAMSAEGIRTQYIWTAKWRRYFSWLNLLDVFKFPVACVQALWYLLWFMPDAIFSKGGAASVPIAIAAFVYRIPILLHDSDAVAGRANRWVARFAKRVAVAFDNARQFFPPEKTMLTGNPVREEILAGSPNEVATVFGLDASQPLLLVVGGSLGARSLNQLVMHALPTLLERGVQVIHVVGEERAREVLASAEAAGIPPHHPLYRPIAFLDARQMGVAYAGATLVLSRAGAGSITELAAMRKASILVPLSSAANDEQRINALEIAKTDGALVLEEANATENLLVETVERLIQDSGRRQAMGEAIHGFYHPDAARLIAEGVISMY